MRKPILPSARAVLLLAALAAVAGCATWNRHDVLTFFFDGVPDPHAATNTPAVVVHATNAPAGAAKGGEDPDLEHAAFVHQPYADKDCVSCHESRFSNKLKAKLPALCYECHDDEAKAAKVVHVPVGDGDCLACHDAHVSNVKKLLIKPVPQLCTECHEDYNIGKFKHDPVEEGACFECHTAHVAKEEKLLKKPDPAVCLECHDKQDMDKVEAHKKDPGARCSKCHDPHSATKEKLLK